MSDCPHYPGLKRPVADWSNPAVPITHPRAYQVALLAPEDCIRCAMERIKKLRLALIDAAILASKLRTYPPQITSGEAHAGITAAFDTIHADERDWYVP